MDRNYFVLFACCIPVKGHGRAVIYDLQRHGYEYIPLLVYDLIQECRYTPLSVLEKRYTPAEWAGALSFIHYLADAEYGFITDTPEDFPDMPMQWHFPGPVINSVIEYDGSQPAFNLQPVIRQLLDLHCHDIQLRLFGHCTMELLNPVFEQIRESTLYTLDLLVPWSPGFDTAALFSRMQKEHRLIPVTLYNCRDASLAAVVNETDDFLKTRVNITKELFRPGTINEKPRQELFVINTEFFTEAQQHNTGLNRKICVDVNGYIRNHIQHKTDFGHVSQQQLKSVLDMPAFQQKWFYKNDQIEKCNTCEYRYMCMDTSDIVIRKGKVYKKKDCGYDPLTQQWAD
ncbi:MAG: grasp-with-spasm system SPASM domain peptide maturase [Bacteroidetes bacterium]|nr:grasp-with-spasm system SPASM domain peptide maturase [Bacteroidota bacterium]